MNELSWMIYAADVADAAGLAFSSAAIISFLGTLAASIVWVCHLGKGSYYSFQDKEEGEQNRELIRKTALSIAKRLPAFATAFMIAAVVVPDADTIYAIAASEMGETVLNSETGGKAIEALNAWLDRQIGDSE